MDKRIDIHISVAGTVNVDMINFEGSGCAEASEQIEILLGGQGAKKTRKTKDEFYDNAACAPSTQVKQAF